ncbi:hypothetical protein BMS3Abin06_01069 [bacterium BMS3Abin06]|nr:hypothetical protein BMS3Abin06_01069 [bacterium BMS3Abin06]
MRASSPLFGFGWFYVCKHLFAFQNPFGHATLSSAIHQKRRMMRKIIILLIAISTISIYQAYANDRDLDKQLRNKWNLMITYLKEGNKEKALELIDPFTRKDYAVMFEALKDQMPQIVSTPVDFKLIEIRDNFAKYELITKEKGILYSYEVIFFERIKGQWFISEF